jgi:hypothetical protein
MTNQPMSQSGASQPMVETRNEFSPFTLEFFWVQGIGFKSMAYRDAAGRWREAFRNGELPGPIQILE